MTVSIDLYGGVLPVAIVSVRMLRDLRTRWGSVKLLYYFARYGALANLMYVHLPISRGFS